MLAHVARFEWRYQRRSPVFWVGIAIFFLLTFGSVTVDQIQIGGKGNTHLNSPFAILQTLGVMSLFATFVVVAMVAGVVLRDDETGFAPILRSTPISKSSYLVGRFLGATAAAFVVTASIPFAIAIGSKMPWVDPEKVGPFVPTHYLYALFVFGLPTLLVIAATFFAIATATRSMMWTYVTTVGLLVLYFVTRGLLRDPRHDTVAALSDPFGLTALSLATKYWTSAERNTLLPRVEGLLLANRLLWTCVSAALFAVAYRRFRFADTHAPGAAPRDERTGAASALAVDGIALPSPRRDRTTRWTQLVALARHDMAFVFRSPAYFVLLGIGVVNAGASAWFTGEMYGSGSYPVTRLMVQALTNAYTIFPIIVAIYYGGELVWRDRERKVHEIVDSTSAPDWVHLAPKVLAIALVLASAALVGVGTGMAVQLAKGYTTLDPFHYVVWFALPLTASAVHLAVLSVFVQVLVPQKFVGWAVMVLYLVLTVALGAAGFEHNLYNYGGESPVPLSDLNGAARFWIGRTWFEVYWTAFATLLVVAAYALWRRGATTELRPRLARAHLRLGGAARALAAVAALVWVGSGATIYVNTNVRNRYVPSPAREKHLAELEKTLLPFRDLPMPRIRKVTLKVDLHPREARAVTHGSYVLVNRTAAPLDRLDVRYDARLSLDSFSGEGLTLEKSYDDYQFRTYRFAKPMAPGESREVVFSTTLEERGFPNGAPLTSVVENGTFLNNEQITPEIGMSRGGLLVDRSKRRKYGLPEDLRPKKLEDPTGGETNMLRADSEWVVADLTVSTDADQTPIAPGYTVSDETHEGRRIAHFVPDAPINHFFSIQSARYAIARDRQDGVDLAVYYHPSHEANVPRMLSAMKASLALFQKRFSPYPFRQLRVLEFPGYADFAQSFANTVPYSENIGFLTKLGEPEAIDVVTYITAHEVAHQWWGHQIVPGDQQGGTMLVESFAQYSAIRVMEEMYGREQVRKFTKYELDKYLRARGGEVVEEVPLARVENQPYIHYQKGAIVMMWMREVLGEDVLDRAMKKLLETYAFKGAPYPSSRDFLSILRAEAGPAHEMLIADSFERITLFDMKAKNAKSKRLPDGRYEVTFDVEGRKLYADGQGKETEAPLDEVFDVGVFAAEPGKKGFTAASVLSFERRPLHSGSQTIAVVVGSEPRFVGVDPYNRRVDRNSDDNLVPVAP